MRSIFGWSYPPGCSGPPESDNYVCICGISMGNAFDYCGASCEQADEEGTVDWDFSNFVDENNIPFVLARQFHNPFHIPTNNELRDFQKEDPNAG